MYFLSSEKSVIKKKKFLKLKKNLKFKKKNRFKRKMFKHHVFINSNILCINRYERFLNS
jgi:hypothetical protein